MTEEKSAELDANVRPRPDKKFHHKAIDIPEDDECKETRFMNLFYFADCYNAVDIARAKTIYNEERKRRNSFVIGGGDWFGGGALSKVDKGDLMLEVLKDFNCCVSSIGNHEFDFGIDNALDKFKSSSDTITWLTTNLDYKGDDSEVNIYDIVTIKCNGKRIGLFAFLDKNTVAKLAPTTGEEFLNHFNLYTDIHVMAKKAVKELKFSVFIGRLR